SFPARACCPPTAWNTTNCRTSFTASCPKTRPSTASTTPCWSPWAKTAAASKGPAAARARCGTCARGAGRRTWPAVCPAGIRRAFHVQKARSFLRPARCRPDGLPRPRGTAGRSGASPAKEQVGEAQQDGCPEQTARAGRRGLLSPARRGSAVLQASGPLEMIDRFADAPHPFVDHTQVVVGDIVVGIQLEGLVVGGYRLLQAPRFLVQVAQVAVRGGKAGAHFNRRGKGLTSQLQLSPAGVADPQLVVSRCRLGIQAHGFLQQRQSFLEKPPGHERLRFLQQRLGAFRVKPGIGVGQRRFHGGCATPRLLWALWP